MTEAALRDSLFSQVPLFSGLDPSQRTQLLAATSIVEIPQGRYLFRRGDPGDALYVVESGTLELLVDDDLPTEHTVRLFSPCDYFGEMALLTGESRSASVRARRDSRVISLPKSSFEMLLKDNPAIALHLSTVLCHRLSLMNENLSRWSSRISLVVPSGEGHRGIELAAGLCRSLNRQLGKPTILVLLGPTPPCLAVTEEPRDLDEALTRSPSLLGGLAIALLSDHILAETAEANIVAALNDLRRRHGHVLVCAAPSVVASHPAVVAEVDNVFLISFGDDDRDVLFRTCDALVAAAGGRQVRLALVERPGRKTRTTGWSIRPSVRLTARPDDLAVVAPEPGRIDPGFQAGVDSFARMMAGATVGLALSGGGAQGMAHLGVMEALFSAGVPVDLIAGTSAGALYGSMIASGMQVSEAERLVIYRTRHNLLDRADFTLPLRGIIRGARLEKMFRDGLGDATFDDLAIPFYAVAADLDTGEEIAIDHGLVYQAVRASISIPGTFEPYSLNGRTLVDGAVVNPLPVSVARGRGADFVIAVQVPPARGAHDLSGRPIVPKSAPRHNLLSTLMRSYYYAADTLANKSAVEADVMIKPAVDHFGWRAYRFSREIIQAGREAGETAVQQIAGLLPVALEPPS